jgi:hypothetical protein
MVVTSAMQSGRFVQVIAVAHSWTNGIHVMAQN